MAGLLVLAAIGAGVFFWPEPSDRRDIGVPVERGGPVTPNPTTADPRPTVTTPETPSPDAIDRDPTDERESPELDRRTPAEPVEQKPESPPPIRSLPTTGTLHITSNQGVSLFVDGEPVGTASPTLSLELPAGSHTLRFVSSDQEEAEQQIEIVAGRRLSSSFYFDLFGMVRVTCRPYASLRLDKEELGFTPVTQRVRAGEHKILLYRDGYRPVEQTITVRPNETNVFRFSIEPIR